MSVALSALVLVKTLVFRSLEDQRKLKRFQVTDRFLVHSLLKKNCFDLDVSQKKKYI